MSTKKFRIKKGLKVQDISNMLEISPSLYYKWESGERLPHLEKARLLARILDTTLDELFFVDKLDEKSK